MSKIGVFLGVVLLTGLSLTQALAAITIPLTVTTSEVVTVTGTPRIAVDVGGVTRYADYTAGTGTNSLTFTLSPVAGDVDLDGITVASPILLNGGSIKDQAGNDATLTFTPPNTSGIKINYPSLGMNFTYDSDGRFSVNGTVYNSISEFITAVGGIFTRSSTATYFDSSGTLQIAAADTPRIDYDPATHSARGLLIEESRTNMTTYSQQLNNAAWSKSNVTVTADAITAPDGTLSADYVAPTGVAGSYISNGGNVSFTAGATISRTAFAKAGTSSKVIFEHKDGTFGNTVFNLATGIITPATGVTASMTNVGNGWYRLQWKKTFTNATPTAGASVIYIDTYGAGVAGHGVYLWGIQTEFGSFSTSYIPTTSSTATRSAEVLNIPIGSWYNAAASAFYAEAYGEDNSIQTYRGRWIGYNSGVILGNGGSLGLIESWTGTSPSTSASYTPVSSQTQTAKSALAWDTTNNTRSLVANGGTVTASSIPGSYNITYLLIGCCGAGSIYLNAPVKTVNYYPLRIANSQLQLMTQ